jgi:uncharacterized protein YceK
MNTNRIALALMVIVVMSACGSTQEHNQTTENNNTSGEMETSMQREGYLKGIIRYSAAEGDCPYAIEVESGDYSYMLDPLNLEEAYKKDGAKVWFKFSPLRMPNRCEKANPVNLITMQERQ